MSVSSRDSRPLAAALLATCAAAPSEALAQQSPPKAVATAIGEVVAAARKRAETLQDGPLTIMPGRELLVQFSLKR
jgi:hypothetical protein